MTEIGRTARWGTAVLVAPLAAAALVAATSWGAAHPPAASGKNSSADQGTVANEDVVVTAAREGASLDKSLLALQRQASAEQASVIRLQKMLNRLNARTRALARAPIPGLSGSSSTGAAMPRGTSGGGSVSVAAPPRAAAAPASAPPATHGSTGAS